LAKRNLPRIIAGIQIDRAQRSPWRHNGGIAVRIEKPLVTAEAISTGVVSRERTRPGEIIRVDIQETALRIKRGSAPFRAAIEAGEHYGFFADRQGYELSATAELSEFFNRPCMRCGCTRRQHVFGQKLPRK